MVPMVGEVNGRLYPRLGMYLRELPNGVDSYPDSIAKASLYQVMRDLADVEVDPARVPEAVADLFAHPPPKTRWIPEVHSVAAHLALFDASGLRESDFMELAKSYTANMAASPMYRVLAFFTSPQRLLSGAAKRWEHIHQGLPIEIDFDVDSKRATIEMQHPPNLWTSLAHDWTASSWGPLLKMSNASGGDVVVRSSSPTGATFDVRWE